MVTNARWLCLWLLLVAGCGGTREMTRPEAPIGGIIGAEKVTEESIRRAMATRPQLSVPTKVAVAEIGTRQTAYLPDYSYCGRPDIQAGIVSLRADEEKLWKETLNKDRPAVGQVIPLAPVLVPDGSDGTLLRLRQAAATLHADLLLVYVRESDWGKQPNALSGLYLTIIGLWASPGTNLRAITVAKGALVDVRNGFVYGVVSADAEDKAISAAVFVDKTRLDLMKRTEAKALAELAGQTAALVDDLARRLAQERSSAAPPDAARPRRHADEPKTAARH
jgi:hypothetical protein